VLAVFSKCKRVFTPDEVQFLLTTANTIGMASERRRAEAAMEKLAAFAQLNPNPALEFAADGTLTGSVDTSHIGPEGGDWRWIIKDTDEKERREYLEKKIAESLPSVTLDSFEFIEPSGLDKPVELHYKVTARQYSHQAGPLLLVRSRVVGSLALPFDDKPRVYPIDLDATGRWRDNFDIAIPPGYVVDEIPDPVSLDLDFASYHSAVSAKGNLLHYEREYVVRQVEIPPTKASAFRHLESVILTDEKNAVVLKKQ